MKGTQSLAREPEPSFQELLEQAAAGDRSAFNAFVQQIEKEVMRTAYYLTQNQADAEDVAQEVYVSLLRQGAGLRSVKNVRGWLFRVTMNASRDLLRKRSRWTELASWFHPVERPASPVSQDVRDRLGGALRRLSFNERAVFVFKELHELSTDEVSELLGCSAVTVRGHLMSAKRKLRVAFQDLGGVS